MDGETNMPIYRWGNPATATEGELVTMYGDDLDDLVPASYFGLRIINDGRTGRLGRVQPPQVLQVPLERVWGFQKEVSRTHVSNLASVPADRFVGDHAPEAIAWPDGTYQVIGHHRASAAYVRGDSTITVRVSKCVVSITNK